MLQNKDIETLRMLFSSHNYVMTTAELTASKLYYADIKQLLDEGLIERVEVTVTGLRLWRKRSCHQSIVSPMQYAVWRLLYSIIDIVTEILLNELAMDKNVQAAYKSIIRL